MIEAVSQGLIRGALHLPGDDPRGAIVLAHGAGSNSNARLLVSLAEGFARRGVAALRVDLPFRQERPTGPPHPSTAARDRDGIREAVHYLQGRGFGALFAGGHSYGGRQTSMLAADEPPLAKALLLLSYPLHPPKKPEQLRVAHFERLTTPALFVHGSKDPFGTPEELRVHVPASASVLVIEKAGHELKYVVLKPALAVDAFLDYSSIVGG